MSEMERTQLLGMTPDELAAYLKDRKSTRLNSSHM